MRRECWVTYRMLEHTLASIPVPPDGPEHAEQRDIRRLVERARNRVFPLSTERRQWEVKTDAT